MEQGNASNTPQEIIDEIIDLCSGDEKTLKACSSTSRAWVFRTRKHLFSKITLTDENLSLWCRAVTTPGTGPASQPLTDPNSLPSSSWLISSHVTTLTIIPTHTPFSPPDLGATQLYQARSHLSAFTNVTLLTLSAISFTGFRDVSLEECFGSLGQTVRELRLAFCPLDEVTFFAILRLFVHLESLQLSRNPWSDATPAEKANFLQKEPPTLRGSLTISDFSATETKLLDHLVKARLQYHTITLDFYHPPTFSKLYGVFENTKNHLKTLILNAPEFNSGRGNQALDLSSCENLVEIQARFNHANFKEFSLVLHTLATPRFEKLSLLITPPLPVIIPNNWAKLDAAVVALAKRVNATVKNNTLEVLFSSYPTDFGVTQLSDIEGALPLIASDARVSLRTQYLPPPVTP